MSGKSIFMWSVAVGMAIAGGWAGIIGLCIWVVGFKALEILFDGCAAFCKGCRESALQRKADKSTLQPIAHKRPNLRVVK